MAVYRDRDRAQLDRDYNARATVPDIQPFVSRYAEESARMRATLPCHLDVAYGPTPDETLDIFPAASGGARSPVLRFIHGGYWRLLGKEDSSFMAETFTRAGATVVAINYALAPRVTLAEIVRQNRAAVAWLHRHVASYGGGPERIHVAGTSAGGHLVGMLLAEGWHARMGVPEDVVRGACAISGLFDLEPVRLCHPNQWLRLDAAAARRNSPIHHVPERSRPLILSFAERDTREFQRQTLAYGEAGRSRGFPCEVLDMPGFNHFDVVLEPANTSSPLTRAVLRQMGLPVRASAALTSP